MFPYWGCQYMIGPSSINHVGRGLFILQDFCVPQGYIVKWMSYGGLEYSWSECYQLSTYIYNMFVYGINCNVASLRERVDMGEKVSHVDRRYIDGRP